MDTGTVDHMCMTLENSVQLRVPIKVKLANKEHTIAQSLKP